MEQQKSNPPLTFEERLQKKKDAEAEIEKDKAEQLRQSQAHRSL